MTATTTRRHLASPPAPRPGAPMIRGVAEFGRTLVITVTVLVLSSALTFGLGALSKTNPGAAVLGVTATPEAIARMNHQFGLDRPLPVQYVSWLGAAFTGDLGRSWFTTIPVAYSIAQALPVDLSVAGLALLLATTLGVTGGIAAALNHGGMLDRGITLVCAALSTLPAYVVAIALIAVFAVRLGWLPSGGFVGLDQDPARWLRFMIMPALALSLDPAASICRQLRTSLVAARRENYVTGAVMRGLPARRVLFGHVMRNSLGPALTALGLGVPVILGGAVVTETVFNLPGIARLALQAAERHDIPVIQGTLLVTIAVVLTANLLVNGAVVLLNPTARRTRGSRRPKGTPA